MENIGVGMPFSDLGQTRVSDLGNLPVERYSVGFMDLLGVHGYALTHTPPMQFPDIPNSSSSEAVTGEEKRRGDEKNEEENGEEHQYKTNTWFKSTKSSEKTKMRVPKVSFITKSEVLHLDDGYKWRKYGQKPVKNSPFPRNYYRCTTSWCDVKKRVERSFSDPSTVITTYEGQHTHHRPGLIMPKTGCTRSNGSASGPHFGLPTLSPQFHQLLDYNNSQQQEALSFSDPRSIDKQENGFDDHAGDNHDHVMKKSRTRDLLDGAALVKDHGLLQDVVSSHIVKEES
ncbi:WRKY transcription factor 68 [Cardamine amara subsp. amara]|uniref:WRKY transcription factor 68 n=1 Tax=Cardamine amara subsp. amara TaxID=228776 RepID=A0ABD1BJ44_CARAN